MIGSQAVRWPQVIPNERIALGDWVGAAALGPHVAIVRVVLQDERGPSSDGTLVVVRGLERVEDQIEADAVKGLVLVAEDEHRVV